MQQTEKYKLNLIERDDAFSPDALNQNTQKVENALTAHAAAVEEVTDALDARLKVLEVKKLAYGHYAATGKTGQDISLTVNLGFTPEVLYLQYALGGGGNMLLLKGDKGFLPDAEIVNGGFRVCSKTGFFNTAGIPYNYLALA